MNFKSIYLIILCLMKYCHGIKHNWDDLHTSVNALLDIFNTEKLLIKNLENFISHSQEEIFIMKMILENLKNFNHATTEDDYTQYNTTNPVLTFRVKLNYLTQLAKYKEQKSENYVEIMKKISKEYDYPSDADLEGASLGLLRVQEVYGIPTEDLANGIINGNDFHTKFKASDCFEIANRFKEMKVPYFAIEWYKMGFKRLEEEEWQGITQPINEIFFLDSLAYSQYIEGSLENAKTAIETSLSGVGKSIDDQNVLQLAINLPEYITHYIALKEGTKKSKSIKPPMGALIRDNITELELLKEGCQGELKKSPAEERELFCTYETKHHKFLLLAPIKLEVLNLVPRLVVFHDVIYDSEIEIFKELSIDKLVRSQVWNYTTGVGDPSKVRTSKFVWFNNDTHSVIHTLNQRISDMTGLSMETAEHFQLMNYGIGGHYDIHSDHMTVPADKTKGKSLQTFGNRIATVLFYLSDVAHGGGTIWPLIKVLTTPIKGTAAFWYNMDIYNNKEPKTRHSACPVIEGSKWVMNKWIRYNGQIFRKPCQARFDTEEMI